MPSLIFRPYTHVVTSVKPKTVTVSCNVPDCDRQWFLEGGHQGFTLASAQSHCRTHWRRYHTEQNHPRAVWKDSTGQEHEDQEFCDVCKRISNEKER